jgi:erythromycin esterase-like protein
MDRRELTAALRRARRTLTGGPEDFDELLARARGARVVMIGEASHGTHEFYRVRAEITKRLIREQACAAVAAEADWPDAYRVNRYVRGLGADPDATEALGDFRRFPQWMWRNADVLDFVGWLKSHNEARPPEQRVGFYGLDLYSLQRSIEAVLDYLRVVDPEAARRAEQRYACFEHFGSDPRTYAQATGLGLAPSCEREVLRQLLELQRQRAEYVRRDGRLEPDEDFFAEQNARLVVGAERYYRSLFAGREPSWNLRDRHMTDTLIAIEEHLLRGGRSGERSGPLVVWAHNSHLGDARATDRRRAGELNVGQLVRERWGAQSLSVGFTTHEGSVTAASDWGADAERKRVRPSLAESWERLFHALGEAGNFALDTQRIAGLRSHELLERAIGVIYRPETERVSHYFQADLPRQFDYVLHYDRTRAVEPLERSAAWERGEVPETFPTAL